MAHRSDRLILLIGAFKLIKAVLLIAVGIGALSMAHDFRVADAVHAIRPSGRFIDEIFAKILDEPPRHLAVLGVGSLVYSVVFVIEGVGLLKRRRWAEYMTVIITTSFIPIEVYEMITKGSWLKAGIIAVNIGVVLYLIWRLRRENAENAEKKAATPRSLQTPAPSDAARA